MKPKSCVGSILVLGLCAASSALSTATKPASAARLELTMEVATTNDDGSPQALRFTLTNIGNGGIDLPVPAIDCDSGEGSIYVRSKIVAGKSEGLGSGHGCGTTPVGGDAPLIDVIKGNWFHLEPGEFLVFTGDGRRMLDKTTGLLTYEYWAEYIPPRVSEKGRAEAERVGHRIPVESVVSTHLTYTERWPMEE